MVGVLIEMRTAVTRRQTTGKRAIGTLLLVLLVTLFAAGTLLAGLKHYRYPGAGANVVATLCLGWLLGRVGGPLVTGDDAALRMDYFKLLPIPARKLGYAMLGAAFIDVSLAFPLIAFAALVALGAQAGVAAALTGVAAMLLELALAVVAGQAAIAVFGPVISSRRGRDFASMLLALVITLLSLASSLVPFVAGRLTNGHSPALQAVVRILPSGWGAVAVDAAGRSDWGLAAAALAGLAALTAVLVLVWPALLARRLMMSPGGARRHTSAHGHARAVKGIPPDTPFGAALGRELRLYARSTLRSMLLMISFLVAVVIAIIGAASGKTTGLPFCGLLFTLIAAACFTNCYGDDGTSLWLTLVVPGAARPDVRGRVWAWFLVVGPAGLLLTVVLTAISGQSWSWPWVLAAEPALVIGCAGLLAAVGAWSVNAPDPDGGPSPLRVLKTHAALIAIPVVVLFPAAALLIPGAIGHSLLLRWLAVPVAIAWAAFLSWRCTQAAVRRLEERGPEIFAGTRAPAA
jgi:ABC-2 type transport system permease protein